jgi:hypothetical protein
MRTALVVMERVGVDWVVRREKLELRIEDKKNNIHAQRASHPARLDS